MWLEADRKPCFLFPERENVVDLRHTFLVLVNINKLPSVHSVGSQQAKAICYQVLDLRKCLPGIYNRQRKKKSALRDRLLIYERTRYDFIHHDFGKRDVRRKTVMM